MNKTIKMSRMIQYIIGFAAAFIILITGPLGLIKHHLTIKSTEVVLEMTDPVSVDNAVMQMFVPQFEGIEGISVYVCTENANTVLQLRVFDAAMNELAMVQQDISNRQEAGFVDFPLDLNLQIGQTYYYSVESLGEEVLLGLEDTLASGITTNATYLYGGMEFPGRNVIARYDVVASLSEKRELFYCVGTALLATLLIGFVQWFFKKKGNEKEIVAGTWIRRIGNPIVAILTVVCGAAIWPAKTFSDRLLDIVVYEAGVVLFAAILFYGLNHKRDEKYDAIVAKLPKYKIADVLQSFCIARTLWYCVEYVNGLSNYEHFESFHQALIWFALSLITTFTKKELLCITNAVWLVVVAIAGFVYKSNFKGVLEDERLMDSTIWIAAAGGIVVLNIIKNMWKKKLCPVNKVYAVLIGALGILMVIFRHGWLWPLVMVVMFLVFFLRFGVWERKAMYTNILANGILLSFVFVLVESLLHRPYHYFMFVRYGLMFHTSTSAAVYLTAVLCAALTKYFYKTKFSCRFADTWKELLGVAVVSAYLIMTLSRTGYVAILVAGAVVILLITSGAWKEKIKRIGVQLCAIGLAIVVGLPICFTATRTIPAVVNEPFTYDIERFVDSIVRGDKPDSRRYMTVGRFVYIFNLRILGMDEENAMIFGSDDPGYVSDIQVTDLLFASAAEEMSPADAALIVLECLNPKKDGSQIYDPTDISNGRFDIYKSYWDNLNWNGHKVMSVDGKVMHAHNIYLQTAYDNGIAAGILLVLVNIASVLFSFVYYKQKKEEKENAVLLPLVAVAFLVAGIVEWNFHPCNPFGMIWLLSMAPLLFDMKKEKKRENEKEAV